MRSHMTGRALVALILLGLLALVVRGLWKAEPAAPPQATGSDRVSTSSEAAVAVGQPNAAPAAAPLPPLTREEILFFIEGMLKPELPAEVRAWTAEQLARATVEDERVDAALRAILEDPEPLVADAAAAALAKRSERAVSASGEAERSNAPPRAGDAAPPGLRVETLD